MSYAPPPQGYPPQGYPPQGYPPQGYPPQGPPQGYPPQGPPQDYTAAQGIPPQLPPQNYSQDTKKQPLGSTADINQIAPTPIYQDVWASVLYVIHLIVFFGLGGYGIYMFANSVQHAPVSNQPSNPNFPNTPTVEIIAPSGATIGGVIGITVGIALFFCAVYLYLMYKQPEKLIYATFFLYILISVAFAIYCVIEGNVGAGIVGLIFAALYGLLFFLWRSRIPFAALVLTSVVEVLRKYPTMINVVLLNLLCATVYCGYWFVSLMGVASANQFTQTGQTIIILYFVFSLYWSFQVFGNVMHCTLNGVYASFYFLEGSGQVVTNPTVSAFKRSMTYSFGSICYGSLLVAMIQFVRFLLRSAARQGSFMGACADCILGYFQRLVEYFNRYAYVQVAMYGKDFCAAANDTWNLFKARGIDAITNDFFLHKVFGMGILFSMVLCGAAGGLVYDALKGKADIVYIYAFICGGMLIGIFFMSLIVTIIDAGIATIFVCVATDPGALARSKPDLYNKFREVYPAVQWT